MDITASVPPGARRTAALAADDVSVRLTAALAAGTHPDDEQIDVLVHRCAVEPDFFVRDMLSWALTRHPAEATLLRLHRELASDRAQARSQALHTLSKIGDRRAWDWIGTDLLRDADDEVARAAWRAAVALVPEADEPDLAAELVRALGRGDRDVHRSLSRALVDLGDAAAPAVDAAVSSTDPTVAAHARATQTLRRDPDAGFGDLLAEAKRVVALGPGASASP